MRQDRAAAANRRQRVGRAALRLLQHRQVGEANGHTCGCSGPGAFSPIASARRYSGSASVVRPCASYSNARLLRAWATSGLLASEGQLGFLERGFEAHRRAAVVALTVGRLAGLHVRLPLGFAGHGGRAAAGQPQQ